MPLSRDVAQALETGRWGGLVSRALASALAPIAARALVRPALVPSGIAVVCIGGATLGGSGKTRLAIACARELGGLTKVALVGHGYRAALSGARVVSADDRLDDVGDEALVCARALASSRVPVVVGPARQAAIDLAVGLSPRPAVLVLDGPLRLRPRSPARALSLLAVDASRPWGSGRLPPAGNLKAPRERLLAEADLVVPVDATPNDVSWDSGASSPIASLGGARLGLFTAIARPDRLLRGLAAAGVHPRTIVSVPDHGPLERSARSSILEADVDAWVSTAKCALHLQGTPLGVPLGILGESVRLPAELVGALAQLARQSS